MVKLLRMAVDAVDSACDLKWEIARGRHVMTMHRRRALQEQFPATLATRAP
ncbi:hypothetical protein [Pigmentiphaga litoralis]|uniref:hypothetical protein n=1 Tax=Pigmentiphaga litoralis TaxID=516702 RepID=UPI00167A7E3B|nr:hypothetical protein [Pigmentiphaga litoralis]